jgi:predicted P-loop ATPase
METRTNIVLDDELVHQAMLRAGVKTKKAAIEAALKAFITQASDTYRLPYARKNTVNPRRTVFFASVNDSKFLSDNTGNRRYWTIDCTDIDYRHQIDMQQFWAEVKTLYQPNTIMYLVVYLDMTVDILIQYYRYLVLIVEADSQIHLDNII